MRFKRICRSGLGLVWILFASRTSFAADNDPTIFGGTTVSTCGWPSVVHLDLIQANSCTGTLVADRLVVTAAHCVDFGIGAVEFGESSGNPSRSIAPSFCATHPGWTGSLGNNTDFGFCVLDQPVDDVPIVPILAGCEVAAIEIGRSATLVGFGYNAFGGVGLGTKREVTTQITTFGGSSCIQYQEIFIGGPGQGIGAGDSGGPAFVQLPDGSWRVFGVASWGCADAQGNPDGSGGGFGPVFETVGWLESASGIDVTPCHDSSGAWNPGPDCQGFPVQPHTAYGSWSNGCSGGPVAEANEVCGSPGGTAGTGDSGVTGDGDEGGPDSGPSATGPDPDPSTTSAGDDDASGDSDTQSAGGEGASGAGEDETAGLSFDGQSTTSCQCTMRQPFTFGAWAWSLLGIFFVRRRGRCGRELGPHRR